MLLSKPFRRWLPRTIGGTRAPAARRRGGAHPGLERLEDRTVPSSFTAASVSDLIADINAANATGGSNTIALVAGKTFTMTAVDNTTDGATGLPVIASGDNLTIVGNGDIIERSTVTGTPLFRLLDVADAASLSLSNLTLQGGVAVTSNFPVPGVPTSFYSLAAGGAIFNQGSLSFGGVSVQNNSAMGQGSGGQGSVAVGGGIYSTGSLMVNASIIQNNQAVGGDSTLAGANGGPAQGGGVYQRGGAVSLTNVTLQNNDAQGGKGGPFEKVYDYATHKFIKVGGSGGSAQGGGIYIDSTFYSSPPTVSLHNCIITQNSATGADGAGSAGGGLYLGPNIVFCLDAFTVANATNNHASLDPDIYGSYTICP
jgi:hypothetical protein